MGKRGKKKNSFVWGFVFLGFAVGVLVAAVIIRYWAPVRPGPPERVEAPPPPVQAPVVEPVARVAIVIDDIGHDIGRLRQLFEVPADLTVAVIPGLRYSALSAREAHDKGFEVLLHMPMEPKDAAANDPGDAALLVSMDREDVRGRVASALDTVRYASGINNHMGSRFTENAELMGVVLGVVRERGIFFLDSRTTPGSVAGRVAREMGVREIERNVFLDNDRSPEYIRERIDELVRIARKRGKAVAIGHPYPETISTLKAAVSELEADGIMVVRASELVE